MSKKAGKKKGIVPLKLQVPLAVVLAIVFVFLLNARLKGGRNGDAMPVPPVDDKVAAADTSVFDCGQRVALLMDKISAEQPRGRLDGEPLPDLAGDPFVKPDNAAAGTGIDEHDPQRAEQRNRYQSREAFIESLTLQATLVDGDANLALINGTLVAENDMMGSFSVVEIEERTALLSDETGNVLLTMKGDDTL
jgi:hypothetical protein